jgi:TolB-like protein/Flp pilus assembly protein TadD
MVSPTERLEKLFGELRRRRVGRVAVAYAVTAWLLVEIADTIFPRLLFPEWTVTALVVAVLVGFPVAVALAWSFDVVPDPASGTTVRHARRWFGVVFAVAILAAAASFSSRWLPRLISSTAEINSLVVLPLENLAGDPEQEYFVSGMYDALIGELSQIGSLRVISRRSAARYADSNKSVAEIARELGVNGVVDGSVTRTANGVQIRVALIKPLPEERQLWSQAFTSELRDVRRMHGEVARNIAQQIRIELTPQQSARLSAGRAMDPATYEAYLRGMYYLQQPPEQGRQKALQYLHEAIELDPANAAAYAGLAHGYATIGHGPAPTPDVWQRAREAAMRAVALDPMMAEAHAALADVKLYYEWDWPGAERAFLRANELNPSLAFNHYHYAWYLALFDRMDEAIAQHKLAQALDPFTPAHTVHLGSLYGMLGRFDDQLREVKKAFELRPDGPGVLAALGSAYLNQGMHEDAIAAHERLVEITPSGKWLLAVTYALTGRAGKARAIATELETQPTPWNAYGLAQIYGTLGDSDRAFEWLSYEPNHAWLPWIRSMEVPRRSWLARFHDDPRYRALLDRMRLPPPQTKAVASQSKSAS